MAPLPSCWLNLFLLVIITVTFTATNAYLSLKALSQQQQQLQLPSAAIAANEQQQQQPLTATAAHDCWLQFSSNQRHLQRSRRRRRHHKHRAGDQERRKWAGKVAVSGNEQQWWPGERFERRTIKSEQQLKEDKEHSGIEEQFNKRRQLDLAVNRLHILESLDNQLRQFADGNDHEMSWSFKQQQVVQEEPLEMAPTTTLISSSIKQQHKSPSVCRLALNLNDDTSLSSSTQVQVRRKEQQLAKCLNKQVPPYMLNLQRQLLGEAKTLAQAVRLMPYRSLVMRSFRQPQVVLLDSDEQQQQQSEFSYQDPVVVELSALNDSNVELIPELPEETPPKVEGEKSNGCDESEQLCYWFRISKELSGKINGSLVQSRESSSWKRERLVEAELHLFKLLPVEQLLSGVSHQRRGAGGGGGYLRTTNSTGNDAAAGEALNEQQPFDSSQMQRLRQQSSQQQQQRTQFHNTRPSPTASSFTATKKSNGWKAQQQQQQRTLNRSSTTAFHLKTNLLEVSLYQILPQSSADSTATKRATQKHSKAQHPKIATQSPPLRLLDIRRMDLYSSGWETFYVKSAVEDWIRDDRLNLGLVIKAKSMFDEPIQIGLIRFADVRFKTPPTTTTTSSNGQPIEWFTDDQNDRRQQVKVQVQVKKEKEKEKEEVSAAERGKSTADRSEAAIKEQQQRSSFDSIHQPILVIYTTTTDQQDR